MPKEAGFDQTPARQHSQGGRAVATPNEERVVHVTQRLCALIHIQPCTRSSPQQRLPAMGQYMPVLDEQQSKAAEIQPLPPTSAGNEPEGHGERMDEKDVQQEM